MDPLSSSSPINNPRLDLLHSSGTNTKTAAPEPDAGTYGAGSYHAAAAPVPPPASEPTPAAPEPTVSELGPKADPATVQPEPKIIPEPRPAGPPPENLPKKSRRWPFVLLALILLIGVGVGAWWWWTNRSSEAPTAPAVTEISPITPTDLHQVDAKGVTIEKGKMTNQTKVNLRFKVETSAGSGSLMPEVELRPVATAFTGEATIKGEAVSANGSNLEFSVPTETLTEGSYHWQARVSKDGQTSPWAIFGNDATGAAFAVDLTPPSTPKLESVDGKAPTNPIVTASNRPVFNGTAEAGNTVTIAIAPESQTLTATTDASGKWTVTASQSITNGNHTLTITAADPAGNASVPAQASLTVNPATAADTAPAATPAAGSGSSPTTQPTASVTPAAPVTPTSTPTSLAPTGDNPWPVTGLGLGLLALAGTGLGLIRRHAQS